MSSLENELHFQAYLRDQLRVVSRASPVPPIVQAYRDFNRNRKILAVFMAARGVSSPPGAVIALDDPRLKEWHDAPVVRDYMTSVRNYVAKESLFRASATSFAASAGWFDPKTDGARISDIISGGLLEMRQREDELDRARPRPSGGGAPIPR